MKKLFTLTTKDWITGMGASKHASTGILNPDSRGINPLGNDENYGLLTSAGAPTDIAGANVVDQPIAYVTNSDDLYILGDDGHLYTQDVLSAPTTTPTDLRSGTPITNPANGLEIFQAAGGSKYLYYWQKTQIGRWDISGSYPTGWTDNWATGLNDTYIHPTHAFAGQIFYGDGSEIGKIYDNSGTPTKVDNVLDIYANFTINSLTDDGTYLVIGATTQTASGTPTSISQNKILFWDTFAPSWAVEWTLPETSALVSVKYSNGLVYALTTEALWACSVGSQPQKIVTLSSTSMRPSFANDSIGHNNQDKLTHYRDGVAWVSTDRVTFFGKMRPESKRTLLPLVYGISGGSSLTIANSSYIHVGADEAYYYSAPDNPGDTSGVAETQYVGLDGTHQIKAVEVIFGEPLAASDSLQVSLVSDEDVSSTLAGTITYALVDAQTNPRKYRLLADGFANAFVAENVAFNLAFNGGAPKVKTINVYGDKIEL